MRHYMKLFEAKNVNGNVNMLKQNLTAIPEEYGIVTGDFWCEQNQLTSLKGVPKEVGNYFVCNNNRLTSLEGAPEKVGDLFDCSDNHLKTLKGISKKIGGDFNCRRNPDLTPWEMRYILFTDLGGIFLSEHEKVNKLVNKFMKLPLINRKAQILEYLEMLKEMQ